MNFLTLFIAISLLASVFGSNHVTSDLDALRECGNLHRIDFKNGASNGTHFSNDHCMLTCVLNGNTLSTNQINEGFVCPSAVNGVSFRTLVKNVRSVVGHEAWSKVKRPN